VARSADDRLVAPSARRRFLAATVASLVTVLSGLIWPTTAWAGVASGRSARASTPTVNLSLLGEVPVGNVSPDSVGEPSNVSPLVLLTSSGVIGIDLVSGKEVWDTPVPFPSGSQTQATVARGLVVTWPASTSADSPLEAIDLATGQVMWTKPNFAEPSSSPGVVAARRTLVTLGSQGLVGLDEANGRRRWTVGAIHGQAPSFPIATDGARIFVTTLPRTGTGWGLAALDPTTHRVAWQTTVPGSGSAAALAVGSQVAAVVTQGIGADGQPLANKLYLFDSGTGRRLWSLVLPGRWNLTDPPLLEGGNVIVSTESGPTPERGQNAITAYRLHGGRVAWRARLQSASYVTGEGTTVFAELPDDTLVAADAATSRVLGIVDLPFEAGGPIYASGNRVASVGFDGNVYVFDADRRG
jgi:outer membrane protein assembly factor BamB